MGLVGEWESSMGVKGKVFESTGGVLFRLLGIQRTGGVEDRSWLSDSLLPQTFGFVKKRCRGVDGGSSSGFGE